MKNKKVTKIGRRIINRVIFSDHTVKIFVIFHDKTNYFYNLASIDDKP